MKITVLYVGKIKEKFYRDAIVEYSKRLSRYCKLEIVEAADEKIPEHASEIVMCKIKGKEAGSIEKNVPQIILQGNRVKQRGVEVGCNVSVEC